MKTTQAKAIDTVFVTLLALALLGAARIALAQGPDYTIEWWTADGGGGTWTDAGGQYVLHGTIGQPDADVLHQGDYTLAGGFWSGGSVAADNTIYLPLVLRRS